MTDAACCSLTLNLPDEAATLALGSRLAVFLSPDRELRLRVILLYGDLGSGKTMLVRGLAGALPGGEEAEVASPSFTLCNIYPTRPPIAHCDLYRMAENAALPEEAEDMLEANGVVVVEWAERLGPQNLPPERLDIRLQACKKARSATLTARGGSAQAVLRELEQPCTPA